MGLYTYMLVFDASLRRQEFVSERVRRKFDVNKVAPGQFPIRVLRFPPVGVIPPILHTHFVLMLLLSRCGGGGGCKPVKRFTKQCFFRMSGRIHRKVLIQCKWIRKEKGSPQSDYASTPIGNRGSIPDGCLFCRVYRPAICLPLPQPLFQ